MSAPPPAPVYRLPLFPLPLVLFPGAEQPLHIFEPRYRRLLVDVQAGDGRFGIVLADGEGAPPAGLVGCEARVRDVEPLADGRSNLTVDGGRRFAVVRLVDAGTPYAVADVAPYDDLPAAEEDRRLVRDAAARARALFDRVAAAAAAIADAPGAPAPLPDDADDLAFAVAARVQFELAARQRILTSRSPLERLEIVGDLLERGVAGVEARAAVHARARGNGKGPHA